MNKTLQRILDRFRSTKEEEEETPEGYEQCFYCKKWKRKEQMNYCLSCRRKVCDKCLPFHEERK